MQLFHGVLKCLPGALAEVVTVLGASKLTDLLLQRGSGGRDDSGRGAYMHHSLHAAVAAAGVFSVHMRISVYVHASSNARLQTVAISAVWQNRLACVECVDGGRGHYTGCRFPQTTPHIQLIITKAHTHPIVGARALPAGAGAMPTYARMQVPAAVHGAPSKDVAVHGVNDGSNSLT